MAAHSAVLQRERVPVPSLPALLVPPVALDLVRLKGIADNLHTSDVEELRDCVSKNE